MDCPKRLNQRILTAPLLASALRVQLLRLWPHDCNVLNTEPYLRDMQIRVHQLRGGV